VTQNGIWLIDVRPLRTLERWAARYYRWGVMGCADDRWLRACTGHRIPEPVREPIYAVRALTLHASRISMASRERKIHQYVREKYDDRVAIASSETLRLVWRDWFGPGGSRQRYTRLAAVAEANATGEHVVIHRPGQVVALDTTPLPVLVRETVFSEPVEAHLSLALDCLHALAGRVPDHPGLGEVGGRGDAAARRDDAAADAS
jgi:hypothetical protein